MIQHAQIITEPVTSDLLKGRRGPCPALNNLNTASHIMWDGAYFPEHEGTLSIKCAFNGVESYRTSESRYDVSDTTYLVLNEGQWYSSYIEEGKQVDALCVFFRPGFMDEVLSSSVAQEDLLLADPTRPRGEKIRFFEQLYRHDDILSPLLFAFQAAMMGGEYTTMWIEEQFHRIARRLLQVHRNVLREIESLPGVRPSTRVERYRRVQRGREFIEAHFNETITLPDIARAACLSPHHFLRLFTGVFGMTPGQYITNRRLEEARLLLSRTDLPVSVICSDVGFESPSTFSTLFRRTTGVSPLKYRLHGSRPC